jgi:hypothetical protein
MAPISPLAEPLTAATLSSSRMLPVVEPLAPLLPDGGLVRGKAVACGGAAAMSLAMSLAVAATGTGSWLAVVDVPTFGLEAAEEFGIALERVVSVDPGRQPAAGERWAELVAAVFDGFEIVVTTVPRRLNAALARRVHARMQAREAVMLTVGGSGPFATDIELCASDPRWEGVAAGSGHLRGRRVMVTSSGRRVPNPRHASLWLPGADGTVAIAEADASVIALVERQAG